MPIWGYMVLQAVITGLGYIGSKFTDAVADGLTDYTVDGLQAYLAEFHPEVSNNALVSNILRNLKMSVTADMSAAVMSAGMKTNTKITNAIEKKKEKINKYYNDKIAAAKAKGLENKVATAQAKQNLNTQRIMELNALNQSASNHLATVTGAHQQSQGYLTGMSGTKLALNDNGKVMQGIHDPNIIQLINAMGNIEPNIP